MAQIAQSGAPDGFIWRSARRQPYTVSGYRQAIVRALRIQSEPLWSPAMIRRSAATVCRRLRGSEGAQRLLGHASPETTELYYDLDEVDYLAEAQSLARCHWGDFLRCDGPKSGA